MRGWRSLATPCSSAWRYVSSLRWEGGRLLEVRYVAGDRRLDRLGACLLHLLHEDDAAAAAGRDRQQRRLHDLRATRPRLRRLRPPLPDLRPARVPAAP